MKVAFFHDAPLLYRGDGQIYSIGFTYNIWKRYLEVFDSMVISTRTIADDLNNNLTTKNMELSSGPSTKFNPITNYRKKTDLFFNKKNIRYQIREALDQCDCAVIRLPSFIGQIAYKEARKVGKPYLIEVVGCAWDAFWNYNFKGKAIAPYMYFTTKKIVLNAPYVIYVTNEFLQRRYPTNGQSTNCSNVELTTFDDRIIEKRIEKINSMSTKDKIIIGTTAAVDVKYKGQQYIIKALGELKKQGITNYEYQMVGDGNQSFLRMISEKYGVVDQVKFLGTMPHNKVFEWLETIDIYAQPSRQEGLPRALIEAMSRALPAFGAKTGGIPELLEDEFVFSNTRKNIDEICDILKSFDKETMKEQAIRNYKESKKYDKEIIEERRRKFFKKFRDSQNNYINN